MAKQGITDDQIEELRAIYPKRPGSLWTKVRKQLDHHLKKGHASFDEILDGTNQYAAYIADQSTRANWEATFTKMAQTFYGPAQHWSADWYVPIKQKKLSAPERIRAKAQDEDSIVSDA